MIASSSRSLVPHRSQQSTSVRKAYIQNLTDLLHVCLLRGEIDRARRAWCILIRCREVDWRSRWHWGLAFLQAAASTETQQATATFQSDQYTGREAEKWLRSVRISAREESKPSLLHALVLHLIKHDRHRAALDELDTYLTSYPYLLSGPLHTYAGLLAFYLAQPVSSRAPPSADADAAAVSRASTPHDSRRSSPTSHSSRSSAHAVPHRPKEPPNPALMRQARGYFSKALILEESDVVAIQFINLIDRPQDSRDEFDSEIDRSRRTDSRSISGKSDDGSKGEDEETVMDEISEKGQDRAGRDSLSSAEGSEGTGSTSSTDSMGRVMRSDEDESDDE